MSSDPKQKIRAFLAANTGRRMLLELAASGELSTLELSERLRVGRPTVLLAVGRAEFVGMVVRTTGRRSPGGWRREPDGTGVPRRNRWRITDAGKAFVATLPPGDSDTDTHKLT